MKDLLDLDRFTVEDLKEYTIENYFNKYITIISLMDIFDIGKIKGGVNNLPDEVSAAIPVIVGGKDIPGAAGMALTKEVLSYVCEKYGLEDVYILPSSVHEVLLCNKSFFEEDTAEEDLLKMVAEVNLGMVEPGETLSFDVYEFNLETKKLRTITE